MKGLPLIDEHDRRLNFNKLAKQIEGVQNMGLVRDDTYPDYIECFDERGYFFVKNIKGIACLFCDPEDLTGHVTAIIQQMGYSVEEAHGSNANIS